jgi:hypothetical protein
LPILGDLPLIGGAFRSDSVQGERNELIIVVTPHIVKPGKPGLPGPAIGSIPTAAPLPTLPPNAHLPPPSGQLTVVSGTVRAPGPTPSPSPATPAVARTPAPLPSAFGQTNVFTFGSPPQSNFAKPSDSVQIFYATLSPTVLSNGAQVHLAVITTSNANAVRLQVGSQSIGLSQTAPGQWQGTFPFPVGAVSVGQSTMTLPLTASRPDGTSATISIPISVSTP